MKPLINCSFRISHDEISWFLAGNNFTGKDLFEQLKGALQKRYNSFEQVQKSVAKPIGIYDTLRPHCSCDMLTPEQAHTKEGVLKKDWKNYFKQKEVVVTTP